MKEKFFILSILSLSYTFSILGPLLIKFTIDSIIGNVPIDRNIFKICKLI